MAELVYKAAEIRDQARALYEQAAAKAGVAVKLVAGPAGLAARRECARLCWPRDASNSSHVLLAEKAKRSRTWKSWWSMGLKGVAAYAYHALTLGSSAPASYAMIYEILSALTEPHTAEELLGLALKVGELNYAVLEQLDRAHTETFGAPTPAPVRLHPLKGKAILVSGHDLHDLYQLLLQTEGMGINIYTHGEMLPAHGYPKLKAFKHLAGNYGGAWVDQADDFDAFPGAVLMTSNCIQQPKKELQAAPVHGWRQWQWPGVEHIDGTDFAPVIAAALAAPGFAEDGPDESITTRLWPQCRAGRGGHSDRCGQSRARCAASFSSAVATALAPAAAITPS